MIEVVAAKSFLPLSSVMWYAKNEVMTDDR